jgi:hypothetical protein
MAERDYFSLRYAVPGFVLILILLITNYIPLLEIIRRAGIDSALGPLLGFVLLFAGPAVGFLITQPWLVWYSYRGGVLGIEDLSGRVLRLELMNKFGMKEEASDKNRKGKRQIGAIFDYILNTYEKDGAVCRYIREGIETYLTLSCTAISIFSGLMLGLFARIYYEISLFGENAFHLTLSEPSRFLGAEFFGLFFVYAIFLFSAVVIWFWGRKKSLGNYENMILAVIHSIEDKDLIELKRLFL